MDRIELMMEADRRGILPPDQKALLNEAIKRGIVTGSTQEPAAVQAGRGLMEIPRQLGLTARHLMEGAGAAVAPIVEPLRLPMSLAARKLGYDRPIMNAEELMRTSADNLGLPLPASANERVVGDAVRMGMVPLRSRRRSRPWRRRYWACTTEGIHASPAAPQGTPSQG